MSAAHTPGPWEIAPETYQHERGETQWRWIGASDWSTRVARVVLYSGEEAQQEANARLIAAAPDLLEALQGAVETGLLEHGGLADSCRAAIAKATGQ